MKKFRLFLSQPHLEEGYEEWTDHGIVVAETEEMAVRKLERVIEDDFLKDAATSEDYDNMKCLVIREDLTQNIHYFCPKTAQEREEEKGVQMTDEATEGNF